MHCLCAADEFCSSPAASKDPQPSALQPSAYNPRSFKGADPTPFGQQAAPTLKVNLFGTAELCSALSPLIRDGGRVSTVASVSGTLNNYSAQLAEVLRSSAESLTAKQVLEMGAQYVDLCVLPLALPLRLSPNMPVRSQQKAGPQ